MKLLILYHRTQKGARNLFGGSFTQFCEKREYRLEENTSLEKLNTILKDTKRSKFSLLTAIV